MFSQSSQRQFWTFPSQDKINCLRVQQNVKFIEKFSPPQITLEQTVAYFLTPDEERLLLKQYELHMREFCKRFEPPMPKCISGTAHHYFKRFYLYNTPMDYHPKEILVTCVYLACKVEEFNVSIGQFVSNVKGDRLKATDIILSNELLLMSHLNYYLTVHNPFRPVEGFIIDIKAQSELINPDRLRPGIDEFLDKIFLTDACLLYPPSQIALAAVLHSASKEQENLDNYVTESLFINAKDKLAGLIDAVRKIRGMYKNLQLPLRDQVKMIDKKLERCRNQENNPDSQIYKQKMKKLQEEDDDVEIIEDSENINDINSSADISMLNDSEIILN